MLTVQNMLVCAPKDSVTSYSCAIPAFLTAELIAFTALWMAVSRVVKSPVAPGTFLCSARMKRVSVIQSVSMACPDILSVQFNTEAENRQLRPSTPQRFNSVHTGQTKNQRKRMVWWHTPPTPKSEWHLFVFGPVWSAPFCREDVIIVIMTFTLLV